MRGREVKCKCKAAFVLHAPTFGLGHEGSDMVISLYLPSRLLTVLNNGAVWPMSDTHRPPVSIFLCCEEVGLRKRASPAFECLADSENCPMFSHHRRCAHGQELCRCAVSHLLNPDRWSMLCSLFVSCHSFLT